jgi:hypothetical protein
VRLFFWKKIFYVYVLHQKRLFLSCPVTMPNSSPCPSLPPRPCVPFVVSLALAVVFGACDSTSLSERRLSPALLDDGESWTYTSVITQRPVDSSAVDTANTAQVRLEAETTDVGFEGRSGLVQVDAFDTSMPEKVDRSWYRQSPDSLVEVAYSIAGYSGFGFLRKAKQVETAPLGRGLTGLPLLVQQRLRKREAPPATAAADTTVREDSRVVLQAPLEQGATWTAFDIRSRDGDRIRNRRTVLGDTTISTPAGRYNAVEVRTTSTVGGTITQWSDFYSEAGLVRRVYTDTLERRDDQGTYIGESVFREVHTLTDHQD